VLCDKPRTAEQVRQLTEFKTAYPILGQSPEKLFVLAIESIEEYYPSPWKKTGSEVANMKGADKVLLARTCGDGISQEQFETEMPIIHNALKRAWDLGY